MNYLSITICLALALLCVSCSPVDPKAELESAHALMLKQDFINALPKTNTCLHIDHDNVDAIILNAVCTYQTTDDPILRKNARLNLAKVTNTLAPDRFDAWYVATWMNVQDQDYDNAITMARKARAIFRAQQNNPTVPPRDACDNYDVQLARQNLTYANLLLLYADICRYNRLEEGLPFFNAIIGLPTFNNKPEIPLAYAQLLYETRYTRYAYDLLKRAARLFPNHVATLYNLAVADESRRRGFKLTPQQNQTLKNLYVRVAFLAQRQGDPTLAAKAKKRMANLR